MEKISLVVIPVVVIYDRQKEQTRVRKKLNWKMKGLKSIFLCDI